MPSESKLSEANGTVPKGAHMFCSTGMFNKKAQDAQRGYGVSFFGDNQDPPGHPPVQPAEGNLL